MWSMITRRSSTTMTCRSVDTPSRQSSSISNIIIGSIFIGSKSGISRFVISVGSLRCGPSIARVRTHKRKTYTRNNSLVASRVYRKRSSYTHLP